MNEQIVGLMVFFDQAASIHGISQDHVIDSFFLDLFHQHRFCPSISDNVKLMTWPQQLGGLWYYFMKPLPLPYISRIYDFLLSPFQGELLRIFIFLYKHIVNPIAKIAIGRMGIFRKVGLEARTDQVDVCGIAKGFLFDKFQKRNSAQFNNWILQYLIDCVYKNIPDIQVEGNFAASGDGIT